MCTGMYIDKYTTERSVAVPIPLYNDLFSDVCKTSEAWQFPLAGRATRHK